MSRMLFERAQRYLGIQEVAGLRDHPLIRWWHSLCTIGETSDQVPWCSSFVNGVCWDERRSRSKSAAARSWLDFGSDGGSIRLPRREPGQHRLHREVCERSDHWRPAGVGAMRYYTAIGGTHDWQRGQWFWCVDPVTGEPVVFAAWMRSQGYQCSRRDSPYWSGLLGGVPFLRMKAWEFGVSVFKEDMERRFPDVTDRHGLTVSHGGAVAMMACANGLKLDSLVTLMMPIRGDLEDVYRAALPNITTYTNVYAESWWRDRFQVLGTLRDGRWRYRRTLELDGVDIVNIGVKKVGHSVLVRKPQQIVRLKTEGILARLSCFIRPATAPCIQQSGGRIR